MVDAEGIVPFLMVVMALPIRVQVEAVHSGVPEDILVVPAVPASSSSVT
jgi:hypothetical protein